MPSKPETKEIEDRLRNWLISPQYESGSFSPHDDLHLYFANLDKWCWCDIAIDAKRVYNTILFPNDPMDDDSIEYILEFLFDAIAAQSAKGVYLALAKTFGLNVEVLQSISDYVYENKDEPYIVPEELKEVSKILNKINKR